MEKSKTLLTCLKCGNQFKRYRSAAKYKKTFCSYVCFQEHRISQTLNHDFFAKVDSEAKAYWLGFVYADGSLSHGRCKQRSISIDLSSKDSKHLLKLANIFGLTIRTYEGQFQNKTFEHSVLTITSSQMWNDLNNKGCCPRKTYNATARILSCVSDNCASHFVRGYFDGDGGISINIKTGGCSLHLIGTLDFITAIRDVICDHAKVKKVKPFARKHTQVAYTLEWSGIQQLVAIRTFLYKDASIFLERKKDQLDQIENRFNKSKMAMFSKYRGVYKSKNGKFYSSIFHHGKSHYLGTFSEEPDAAKAYDRAIMVYKKPMYRLNFPIE